MTTATVDETLLLSWDTCDLEEGSDGSFEWECMVENLTEMMKEMGATRWYAEGSNMGWRHLSGQKRFVAEDGQEFLQSFLPKTDCTFSFHRLPNGEKGFRVRNAHHDAPTGESYYIYPVEDVDVKITIPVDHMVLLAVLEDASSWTSSCGLVGPKEWQRRYDFPLKDGHSAAVVMTWRKWQNANHLWAEVRFFRPGDDESYAEYQLRPCYGREGWETEIDSDELYNFKIKIVGQRLVHMPQRRMLSNPKTPKGKRARLRIICAAMGVIPGTQGKPRRDRR